MKSSFVPVTLPINAVISAAYTASNNGVSSDNDSKKEIARTTTTATTTSSNEVEKNDDHHHTPFARKIRLALALAVGAVIVAILNGYRHLHYQTKKIEEIDKTSSYLYYLQREFSAGETSINKEEREIIRKIRELNLPEKDGKKWVGETNRKKVIELTEKLTDKNFGDSPPNKNIALTFSYENSLLVCLLTGIGLGKIVRANKLDEILNIVEKNLDITIRKIKYEF